MIFRIWPRPMRLSPLGVVTRTKVVRKASLGGKKDPESGSKAGADTGVRVMDKAGERRQQMLAHWLKTRRVDSVTKGKKGAGRGAVAAALAGRAQFDATAQMTGRVYRDLKAAKPMASG